METGDIQKIHYMIQAVFLFLQRKWKSFLLFFSNIGILSRSTLIKSLPFKKESSMSYTM